MSGFVVAEIFETTTAVAVRKHCHFSNKDLLMRTQSAKLRTISPTAARLEQLSRELNQ